MPPKNLKSKLNTNPIRTFILQKDQEIHELKLELEQTKAALKESRAYADKLVDCIPYLPADLQNCRQTTLQLTVELDECRQALKDAQSTPCADDEFHKAYRLLEHLGINTLDANSKIRSLSDCIDELNTNWREWIYTFEATVKEMKTLDDPQEFPGPWKAREAAWGAHALAGDVTDRNGSFIANAISPEMAQLIADCANCVLSVAEQRRK